MTGDGDSQVLGSRGGVLTAVGVALPVSLCLRFKNGDASTSVLKLGHYRVTAVPASVQTALDPIVCTKFLH